MVLLGLLLVFAVVMVHTMRFPLVAVHARRHGVVSQPESDRMASRSMKICEFYDENDP